MTKRGPYRDNSRTPRERRDQRPDEGGKQPKGARGGTGGFRGQRGGTGAGRNESTTGRRGQENRDEAGAKRLHSPW